MTAITIGYAATNRGSLELTTYTYVNGGSNGLADGTGTITDVEIYFVTDFDGADVKVGTWGEITVNSIYDNRDYATLGAVTSGSMQTFSGLSIDVVTGDSIGAYFSSGRIEAAASALGTVVYSADSTDYFDYGTHTFDGYSAGHGMSLHGIGTTAVGWANIAKVNGVAVAAIAKVNGVAV